MIWMTWRQFRVQAAVAAAALTSFAVYVVRLGTEIRDTHQDVLARCAVQGGCGDLLTQFEQAYQNRAYYLSAVILVLPALIGTFWGAPLVAREFGAGTHRLVWNQSVTRRRWLAVKLLFLGLASTAVTGLFSLLRTWAASPVDEIAADRFSAVMFGTRSIAPVAYAAFALALGTVLGMLIRRAVAAMALTMLVMVVIQVATPALIRPHLSPPVTASQPMTAEAIGRLGFFGNHATVKGFEIPNAWVVSTSRLLTSDGRPLDDERYEACIAPGAPKNCLADLDLHLDLSYQPARRYWRFQWLESAVFLALAALIAGFGLWRVRARPS